MKNLGTGNLIPHNISKKLSALFTVLLFVFLVGCNYTASSTDKGGIKLSASSLVGTVGESVTLTVISDSDTVFWDSLDEQIAVVYDGMVTFVGEGFTVITATDGIQTAICNVTVVEKTEQPEKTPVTVTISQSSATLKIGGELALTATASDGGAIVWNSGNEQVATVDENGVVTGMGIGTALISASCGNIEETCVVTVTENGKKLVWSDEFDDNALDMTKWSYQTGTQDVYGKSEGPVYWGNDEMQYYTAGENLTVSNGTLKITAKKENRGDRTFTSSRIVTRDKAFFTYGYFEARIKLPAVAGLWPAFWMLPNPSSASSTDNIYGGWPANGEIDIMEARGRVENKVDCTLHFGSTWLNHGMKSKSVSLDKTIEEWHTYALDWRADSMAWVIDGVEVYRVNSSSWWTSASSEQSAPFDRPFYIIFNLAVGGSYDGYTVPPDGFSSATMRIDYIRVYEAD